jgi:hypothetical protein
MTNKFLGRRKVWQEEIVEERNQGATTEELRASCNLELDKQMSEGTVNDRLENDVEGIYSKKRMQPTRAIHSLLQNHVTNEKILAFLFP